MNVNTIQNIYWRSCAVIPVFPGTNCEYDSEKAFIDAGASPTTVVIRNTRENDIENQLTNL